ERQFVKSLNERHSVNVRFPRFDVESDVVVLSGMKVSVDKAKAELLELLEYEKSLNHTTTITAEPAILQQVMGVSPHSKFRLIQILQETNTRAE
ncbi:hypothetical protein J4G37_63165, partial [Microvirga sp. 3-52]|nr:hypothetical protein [Microvirga sp. 3-52]